MDGDADTRKALVQVLDQLASARYRQHARRADLLLRAVQLRCALARSAGEIIPPTEPGMKCVVHDSPFGRACPHCPAAATPPDTPAEQD
jgi:hypothetical protein